VTDSAEAGPNGPPDPKVSDATLDFGSVDCGGAAPADRTVKITNAGGGTVNWVAQVDSPVFSIVGATSGAFAPEGSATVTLRASRVSESASAGAVLQAVLLILAEAKSFRVPVQLTAQGASFTVTPASAAFGLVPLGVQATDLPLVFKNTGTKGAKVSLGAASNGDFAVTWMGAPAAVDVAPGGAVAGLVARFKPSTLTAASGSASIKIEGSTCGASPKQLTLTGQGASGVVGYSPATLDFGLTNCGGQAASKSLMILNTGNQSFDFSLTPSTRYDLSQAAGTVLPSAEVQVLIAPKPVPAISSTDTNALGDTLVLRTTAAGDPPHNITLLQTAQGAVLSFSPTSLDFGSVPVFSNPPPLALTVTNSGNATANVTLATTSGNVTVSPGGPTPLAGGAQLPASVTYPAAAIGQANDTVTISTADTLCAPLPNGVPVTAAAF
jgi:hypothetical protein